MDNLCHTLAGAAFAEAGLKRTTRYGSATLIIASNIPDLDVLVFATDVPSVAFRRGWTHGVLAQILLPVLFAAMVSWAGRSAQTERAGPPARFGALLLLSYVGVLSHVALDLLNNYGVRLLMPFSGRWFYGDSVFIIDVWLWLILGSGVWIARTRDRSRPARTALVISAAYIGAMILSARLARDIVREDWAARSGRAPRALMVGPVPMVPWRRTVIVDAGSELATGSFSWLPYGLRYHPDRIPKNDDHPAVRAAIANDERLQAVLTWARFPYYRVESTPAGEVVTMRDARFGDRVGLVRAVVGAPPGSARRADRSR